jgi:metal-sulfur cluster biosynthetic enzyme
VADQIVEEVKTKTELVPQVKEANVKIVFEPEWTPDKMSEEAKLELGFF